MEDVGRSGVNRYSDTQDLYIRVRIALHMMFIMLKLSDSLMLHYSLINLIFDLISRGEFKNA